MSTSSTEENPGAALPPMALLATLQTAWAVKGGISRRRTGRDPTAQQPPEDARAYLAEAARELTRLHMQLLMAKAHRARRITTPRRPAENGRADGSHAESSHTDDSHAGDARDALPPARLAATVRRFDTLMKLRRVERLLHGAHQRLMSLYPAVSEELVEEARRCRGALADLRDAAVPASHGGGFGEPLTLFLQRLISFAAWLEREM